MKIATVTFHRALNYGAVFQTFALQSKLQQLGQEVEVLDYRSPFIENHYRKKKLKDYLSIKRIAIVLLLNGYSITKRSTFEEFSRKNIHTSKNSYTPENLADANEKYDLFIAGSDQIWNYKTAGFDKNYFLTFVTDSKKKNSYAASIGLSELPVEYYDEYYRLLKDFHKISVREDEGNRILSKLLDRNDIHTVLDPTLLLEKKHWMAIESPVDVPRRYVLVYLLYESKKILNFAKRVAQRNDCQVLYINDRLFPTAGVKNIRHCKPDEWLYMFRNATYVVTNSFHGTAFSIIFNKQFWVDYLPKLNPANSRITSLLGRLELRNRIISEGATVDIEAIDYSRVQMLLKKEVSLSELYLEMITNNP